MISVHKGLIFALPILLAPPAIAQTNDVMWKPSPQLPTGGKACKDVCSDQGLVAVDSGVYSKTSPPRLILSAERMHRRQAQGQGTKCRPTLWFHLLLAG